VTPAPSGKTQNGADAILRTFYWRNFTLRFTVAMGSRVRRYQTSQNGVRAILRVQGRALPPTAQVI
jgi:hypothetical protein